jgi:hypothetical protein
LHGLLDLPGEFKENGFTLVAHRPSCHSLQALREGNAMIFRISSVKLALLSVAAWLCLADFAYAQSGTPGLPPLPAGRRPKMPPKPPILGIPNGGRDGRWQEGHGAYGNTQGSASGQAAGQAGQFGQGGGFGGGALGGLGGGGFGGGALGGLGGGGGFGGGALGGGGLKGFGVGGGLLGPEPSYQNGVGIYGGKASLDGLAPLDDTRRGSTATTKPTTYYALMLSPVVVQVLNSR